jgi:hypothetical protein
MKGLKANSFSAGVSWFVPGLPVFKSAISNHPNFGVAVLSFGKSIFKSAFRKLASLDVRCFGFCLRHVDLKFRNPQSST